MWRACALVAASVLWSPASLAQQQPPKPDPARGQTIAAKICAACHGPDGNSTAAANPKIAGQFPEYLQKQLGDFKAQQGKKPARESPVMAPMVANLSPQDMHNVAAYFGGQKLRPATASDKDLAALGQKLWRGGNATSGVPACAGCHGPAGRGHPARSSRPFRPVRLDGVAQPPPF